MINAVNPRPLWHQEFSYSRRASGNSTFLVTWLYLPHAIPVGLHVHGLGVFILTPEAVGAAGGGTIAHPQGAMYVGR